MKIAFFDAHQFEKKTFEKQNAEYGFEISYFESRLTSKTALLALGFPVVCAFVSDLLDAETLGKLKNNGTRLVALRSAGFNHVDIAAAQRLGITVMRVPEYSPYSVAEHTIALLMTLNRKIHRAYNRVRESNFSLEGLVGFDMHGKTVGIVGLGRIGKIVAKILHGFGCRILAFDSSKDPKFSIQVPVEYVELDVLFRSSDVISLNVPLNLETKHMIDERAFSKMKTGAIIINTGRGGVIDTKALIKYLKNHHLGGAGLDVYEEETGIFFQDCSNEGIQDDTLARLLTFPNVVITSHQGFLTQEAINNIAITTLQNVKDFSLGLPLENEVRA